MKYKILLYALVAATFTGCSSAYRASQTPDDVYYSPARPGAAEKVARAQNDQYEDYVSSQDDQYLRMKVRDRQRWSGLDDYAYWNDSRYVPYYTYDYYRNNNFNVYALNNWNNMYYSPYYSPYYSGAGYFNGYFSPYSYYGQGSYLPIYITKTPVKTSPNVTRPNLNSYRNSGYSNQNNNNAGSRQGLGSSLKRVLQPGNNNSSYSNRNSNTYTAPERTYTAPERTYTPSSNSSSRSSSSSSNSGSSSGGGVSRPSRN